MLSRIKMSLDAYLLLITIFLRWSFVVAAGHVIGCRSLNIGGETCFLSNVEILPFVHISESGIIYNVPTVDGCQDLCVNNHDCAYFTFRVHKKSNIASCHLRPGPGDDSAAMVVGVLHDDATSEFSYTSGPKSCKSDCIDGAEIAVGCGGSSPSACKMIGDSSFDSSCAVSQPAIACGFKGYSCCRSCKIEGACCKNSAVGFVLTGGVHFENSVSSGVRSADHCHTLCVKTFNCSHWNYVTNMSLWFIGGACYMKTYDPLDQPEFVKASPDEISVVGSVDCTKDYGVSKLISAGTTTTTTAATPAGEPVPGTCFSSKANIIDGSLYKQWGVHDAGSCQRLCQTWPGCKSFVLYIKETKCELKFTSSFAVTVTDSDAQEFISGPRDCPYQTPAPAVDGCIAGDLDIALPDLNNLSAEHAAECGNKCKWFGHCKGWTYYLNRCYIKGDEAPTEPKVGAASGGRGCEWPGYTQSRQLDDVLPHVTRSWCVLDDAKFVGGDLDNIREVESLEDCRFKCLKRPDCKAIVYSDSNKICTVSWGGKLANVPGLKSMPRDCLPGTCVGNQCPNEDEIQTDGAVQPVSGLAQHALGRASNWLRRKASLIDLVSSANRTQISVHILTNEEHVCYVSGNDIVFSGEAGFPDCSIPPSNYLPLQLRVQVVVVKSGVHFDWDSLFKPHLEESVPVVELFDQVVDVDETGVFVYSIGPSQWKSKETHANLLDAEYYARYQSLKTPVPISFRVMFCIAAGVGEVCSEPVAVPAYNV